MTRRPLLEDVSQPIDLFEVLDPQLRDEVAAPWTVGQLTFLLEHAQRLADGSDADADALGDVLLDDPVARREVARDDGLPQARDRILLRGSGTAHRSVHRGDGIGRRRHQL